MTHHKHNDDAQALCPACGIGPFIRNNYFTGKLMLERDFTDEQRYFIEKIRHHHQRLHGWGVVCGLKVKQHANPACRDRFICIEPGTAIDCCGHEIVVREEECIDITQLPSIRELIDKNDKEPHVLQICLRYRECPTEEIPVLYDECGCDDTRCAPNRILESYDIDVMIIDPLATSLDAVHSPRLMWKDNVTLLVDVSRTAVYDPGHRMYLLVGDDVYSVDTTTTSPIVGPNFHLATDGLEMAVSNNGKLLFVVTKPLSATDELQMVVLQTSDMTLLYPPFDLQTSIGSDVRLVVASDDSLMALVGKSGNILIWTDAELTGVSAPGPRTPVSLAAGLQSLSVAANAQRGYAVGSTSNVIYVLNATGGGSADTNITILPSSAKPTIVVVVQSGGTEFLVVADTTGKKLYLVSLNPLSLLGQVGLTHEPIGLAISPGGHWAYILERKDDQSFVQVVDLYRLQQALPTDASVPLQVGDNSQQIIISASGKFLYIPFLGMPANTFDGGVAKIEVNEGACEEILWRHLDGCPQCDTSNCVVLATIENYQVGNKVEDQTDPPKKLGEDKAARIDNRKGRQLLPSTQVLLEMIKCLMQHGPGGTGTQGQPGAPGTDGLGIDAVQATIIDCDKIPAQPLLTMIDGQRTLELEIPRGCNGADGSNSDQGLELGLTRIEALSWSHAQSHKPEDFIVQIEGEGEEHFGIVIGFTAEVDVENTIDPEHILQVLVETRREEDTSLGFFCRCPIRGTTIPVDLDLDGDRIRKNPAGRIEKAKASTNGSKARGVAFILDINIRIAREIINGNVPHLWVILRGDFVKDTKKRAIDAEFVRAELPTGDRSRPPAGMPLDKQPGTQGGTFESWFSVQREQ